MNPPARKDVRKAMVAAVALLATCAVIVALIVAVGPTRSLSPERNPAPAYEAFTLDGQPVSLAGLRGQVVMLNIWATWCTPCREEMPRLQDLHAQYEGRGFTVIGASVDATSADVQAMAESAGAHYPIWLDPDDRATMAFRLIGVPATILISADGYVLHEWKEQFDPLSPEVQQLVQDALAHRDAGAAKA